MLTYEAKGGWGQTVVPGLNFSERIKLPDIMGGHLWFSSIAGHVGEANFSIKLPMCSKRQTLTFFTPCHSFSI